VVAVWGRVQLQRRGSEGGGGHPCGAVAVVLRALPRRPCRGELAACGVTTVAPRAVVRLSCRVLCCDGCVACSCETAVSPAACSAATVVLRAVAATVVPRAVLRRPCRVRLRRSCPVCDGRAACAAAMVVPPVELRALCSLELLGAPCTPRAAHVEPRVHPTAFAARRPLDAARGLCRVRCLDGRAAHSAATFVPRAVTRRTCRVRPRRSCRVRCLEGLAASATVVPRAVVRRSCRARCHDGRAAWGAATVVPRAAPTVVPRAVPRRSCRVRCRDGRAACGRGACGAATAVP